ncbi:bifunctional 5,10-methylenetetrahydrofolate dehydrogenase/5,10-methenyltetrahydrofolate cyclohydrolase [Candidatus Saccharibacteria bacterium]|nr:bifunctional 5,10-methylenetetrahydrofolate dehydrogenase/5,10-methenyltetrahydrofolate cyclohydrolase [Candidatus Saccharibacteria bacterium]
MKILNGAELAGYIKERQAKQVRALVQSQHTNPKLAIIKTGDNSVVDLYVGLKSAYGEDIGVQVEVFTPSDSDLVEQVKKLNNDNTTHGIIIQLPLANPDLTEDVLRAVDSQKDVDGLGSGHIYTPATAMAIDWLLNGFNVQFNDKKIAIVGRGRLVGGPLARLWEGADYDVALYGRDADLKTELPHADIIVSATGVPGLITGEMIRNGAVVVDAGTASESGKIVGDLADDVRMREDLTITPVKGGVGPLTVSALFDNVISSARRYADQTRQ